MYLTADPRQPFKVLEKVENAKVIHPLMCRDVCAARERSVERRSEVDLGVMYYINSGDQGVMRRY